MLGAIMRQPMPEGGCPKFGPTSMASGQIIRRLLKIDINDVPFYDKSGGLTPASPEETWNQGYSGSVTCRTAQIRAAQDRAARIRDGQVRAARVRATHICAA